MPQDNTNILPSMGIVRFKTSMTDRSIVIEGLCVTKLRGSNERFDAHKVRIDTLEHKDAAKISFTSRFGIGIPGKSALNRFRLEIDIEKAREWDIQNKLYIVYDGRWRNRISYAVFDKRKGRNNNSKIHIRDGMAMYFRQNVKNSIYFTIRDVNEYDYPEGQKRLEEAFKRSQKTAGRDLVLMYEKNCEKYEESASVLYEKLRDEGYDNVYYIVDKSNPEIQDLAEKYKAGLIDKGSDKHLEYFFACNKFISTETIDHALQLRVANKLVQDKITGDGIEYVFLQHGVMYMVSLNSRLRVGFKQKKNYKLHKTVVSSRTEAQHFIDFAEMKPEDLYITGLAKFDRCYRNDDADKIIIMPTWRRWETNQAKKDITQTAYYKMIERMCNAVPERLKDRIVILPHPLMSERFNSDKEGLGKHIMRTSSYDKVLRDCALLITDYSSIAYDAFYRGSNVIFCWEEKDECMQHYGEGTHLMLNENNAFGPICMNEKDLSNAIEKLYSKEQEGVYVDRYRQIVEFNDRRNSDRIIALLKKDGLIT